MRIKHYILMLFLGLINLSVFSSPEYDYPHCEELPSEQNYSLFSGSLPSERGLTDPPIMRSYDPNEDPMNPTPGGAVPLNNGERTLLLMAIIYGIYIIRRTKRSKIKS